MSDKILKNSDLGKKLGEGGGVAIPTISHQGIVRKDELKALDKAQLIIDEARKEAAKIREEAESLKAKIERETEEARAQGFEEGKREGLESFTDALLKVRESKEKFFAEAEAEVIKLVLTVSEKVIGKLAQEYKEVVVSIIQQAMERSLGDRIVVRLHPEDWKRIQTEEKAFKERLDKTKHLHFKEDDTIERGGCVVETEIGTIDAQLDTQLKAIRKALES